MKKILLPLLLLCAVTASAQQKEGIHQWMFRTQGTVAIGFDANRLWSEQRYYIYGESELLLSDHIGVNGSAWANIGSSERVVLTRGGGLMEDAFVHSVLAGPVFHAFSHQPLDIYVGIQPGFSLTSIRYPSPNEIYATSRQFSPTATIHGGIAYYGSFFHLFAQARYFRTQHTSIEAVRSLNDLRICIGLGFNFN